LSEAEAGQLLREVGVEGVELRIRQEVEIAAERKAQSWIAMDEQRAARLTRERERG